MGGGKRRARRALERQLAYQRAKAERIRGHEPAVMADMAEQSAAVQAKLAAVGHIAAEARVLEVGSGAHGLIFFFDGAHRDASFDVVLCDNVVDHAEKSAQRAGCSRGLPLRIIERSDTIAETMRAGRALPARHAGDRLKRWFFKNARWEAIAVREG